MHVGACDSPPPPAPTNRWQAVQLPKTHSTTLKRAASSCLTLSKIVLDGTQMTLNPVGRYRHQNSVSMVCFQPGHDQ